MSLCKKSPSGSHEADWKSVNISEDGDIYIDISCKHCRQSGCIGTQETLEENISWE